MAADLAVLDAAVSDPAAADRQLMQFLTAGAGGCFDQAPVAAYRALVDLFDREWIGRAYQVG